MALYNRKAKRIIIDEEAEAVRLLENPEPYFSYGSVKLLARYYYSHGYKKKDVRNMIYVYLDGMSGYNPIEHEKDIEDILKKAKDAQLRKSGYNIAITKKEIEKLKVLPHKEYKIALYMLFLAKLGKHQPSKSKRPKNFKTFLKFHDVKTCAYNVGINLTHRQSLQMAHRFYLAGIIEPTFIGDDTIVVSCADDSNKDVAFIISGNEDFESQIKYYCVECGNETVKAKKHDFCTTCHSKKKREDTKNRVAKWRRNN